MNKHEFLAALRRELEGLPHGEAVERLNFYGEMIDDRMEEGMTEEAAVAAVGSVESIAAGIMASEEGGAVTDADPASASTDGDYRDTVSDFADTISDFSETVTDFQATFSDFAETATHGERKTSREKEPLPVWGILLILLGSPLWAPLLIAAAAVAFSLLASLWTVAASLWAVPVSLLAGGLGGVLASPVLLAGGHWITALAILGCGLFAAGLGIFAVFGCAALTKGMAYLTRACCRGVASLFRRRKGEA